MSGVDQESEEVTAMTAEQEAEDDAAFEAAFNTARGDSHHGEGPTLDKGSDGTPLIKEVPIEKDGKTDEEVAAQAAADAAAQAAADAQAAANAPAVVTAAELNDLRSAVALIPALQAELKRTTDSTAGRIGSLKQTLDAVKAQAQQGVRPSLKQLKNLEGDFPELAALLSKDLEEAFGANTPAAEPVADTPKDDDTQASGDAPGAEVVVDPFADPRVQETLRAKEMKIVSLAHPDWKELTLTPEFAQWKNSLPPAAQQLLGSTWDSSIMTEAFTDFKAYRAKQAAAVDANKQRVTRLENGIPPTNGAATGAHVPDEDAAFEAGFKKASKGR